MLRAFPIGRLFGIRLDVQTSWFPVFALIVALLAHVPALAALGTGPAYAIAALAAIVLFASVVVHELAHALTAGRFGVGTRSITLFSFGGIALLEAEPPEPLADALVALAGPAASGVVALAGFGAMHLVDAVVPAHFTDAAASMLAYVTVANAALAVFNLIPAYPMDGGRVLRAIVWYARGDRDRATSAAALTGAVIGMCVAAGGIAAAVVTKTWQFAWLPIVAAYLVRASISQYLTLRRAAGPVETLVSVRSTQSASGVVSVGSRTANQSSG